MADTEKYYDFHCGNDPRLVKVAIKNESFHTLTIRSHIARAIDFSGGTALIETIRLSKCVKASRIIWPEHTGAIKRLFISNNDNLVKLDISSLTSLEELSILNCRSLEDIVGMPDTMKEINIHYAKIKELNLQRCGKLQKINIITNAAAFNLDLTDHKKVQMAMVTTSKSIYNEKKPSTINIQNAQCLHTVAIDTGDNTASLDVTGCTHLKTLIVNAGEDSNISGLNDCKDLEFYHAADSIEIDEPSKATLLAIKERLNNTPDAKNPELKIASIIKIGEEFQASTKNNRLNIHDRETNIQVNGSQSEVSKANAARISILSAPTDLNDLVEQKDLSKMLRNIVLDDASSSPSHLATLYFLPALPFLINRIHTSSNIRLIDRKSPVKNILAWLNNNEGFTPNLLMINQNDLKSNVVKNL